MKTLRDMKVALKVEALAHDVTVMLESINTVLDEVASKNNINKKISKFVKKGDTCYYQMHVRR